MRKWSLWLLSAAFACTVLAARGDGSQEKKCDLSKVEQRHYCEACKAICGKQDLDEKGNCKACGKKAGNADVCVKKAMECSAHTGKLHSKDCGAQKGCCKETEVLALVIFKCDKCGASARTQAAVKHEGCDGKVGKTCEKSGTWPHGGSESM